LIVLSLTLTDEYSGVYSISARSEFIYQLASISIAGLAFIFIVLGLFSSNKRWIKKRGTDNLNSFKHLAFFAYVRHPITFSCMLISISIMLMIQSILSNVLAGLALIVFTISSFEKDLFFQKLYGYPYKVYSRKVPRFNIFHGMIRSFIIRERNKGNADDLVIYD
jgi:protein-S-isoprenylcysteine O-methyltransferase Ste14